LYLNSEEIRNSFSILRKAKTVQDRTLEKVPRYGQLEMLQQKGNGRVHKCLPNSVFESNGDVAILVGNLKWTLARSVIPRISMC
jgi:hypothetical protein